MKDLYTRRIFILRSVEGAVAASLIPAAFLRLPPLTPRLGIIGLGETGSALLDDCARQSLRVVALCDLDPLAIRVHRAAFPSASIHSDFHRLLEAPEVDVVVIATPHASRIAETALYHGRHVFFASPDQSELSCVENMTRLASAKSLRVGIAPYDPTWDVDALDEFLGPRPSASGGRTRFSLLTSPIGAAEDLGFDLLHHAVRLAANCLPAKVRAARSGGAVRSWSASFGLESDWVVDLHVQSLSNLLPGQMSLTMESGSGSVRSRVVIESVPESESADRAARAPEVPGFTRFLRSLQSNSAAPRSSVELGVLHWSALLRDAFHSP